MVQGKGGVRPSGVIVSCGDKEIFHLYAEQPDDGGQKNQN